jgi:hypothetical protein
MAATKSAVLKRAASEISYAEKPVNKTKYGKWYGLDGQPWCAMFVSWVANQEASLDIIPKHAYTPSGANWFKKQKRWHTSGPKSGDVAYFKFPGGPNRIHHVGFVESVRSDGMLVTIEGNTSPADNRNGGMVMRRVRNPKYVVGYGRPKYKAAVRKYPGKVITRKSKSAVADVKWVQTRLNLHGANPKLVVDGVFGNNSYKAGKKFRLAKFKGRPQLGNIGPATWDALAKKPK